MLKHQQLREQQAACRAKLAAHELSVKDYVDEMTRLASELAEEEKKMYAVARTVPPNWRKIHERFRHLSIDEVIAFEQIVLEAGGEVMTHSGVFAPTKRSGQWDRGSDSYEFAITWTCCHTSAFCGSGQYVRVYPQHDENGIWRGDANTTLGFTGRSQTPDLTNRAPIGRCDKPVAFSLIEGKKESTRVGGAAAEIRVATQTRIDELEREVLEKRRQIALLDDFLVTLDRRFG
jgi:hypothetical protein